MKVLTLHQPWASLIALGVKTIETRSWRSPASLIGERIAIHAAAKEPTCGQKIGDYQVSHPKLPKNAPWELWTSARHLRHVNFPLPLGSIVATARLADCVKSPEWADDEDGLRVTWSRFGSPGWTFVGLGDCFIDEGQRPYGHFGEGRWLWLLEDIEPLAEPVPFKGGQGLSRSWEPHVEVGL